MTLYLHQPASKNVYEHGDGEKDQIEKKHLRKQGAIWELGQNGKPGCASQRRGLRRSYGIWVSNLNVFKNKILIYHIRWVGTLIEPFLQMRKGDRLDFNLRQ